MSEQVAELSSEALLGRYKEKGDPEAFGALFDKHERDLMSFVHGKLTVQRDQIRQAAEDICSETWLQFPSAALRFENKSSFKSWICSIGKNKVSDLVTKVRRSPEKQLSPGKDGEDPWAGFRDESYHADEAVSKSERGQRLQKAVADLPQDLRDVLVMRVQEGLHYDVVCAELKISEREARDRYYEATSILRKALADYEDEAPGRRKPRGV